MEKYKREVYQTIEQSIENPINWKMLQNKNTDVYGWIQIPGTEIDYPIVAAPDGEDEDFYLHRNIKRQLDFAGMIYSRRANKKDFSDFDTILYGHNMRNGSMFGGICKFEDKKYFDQHEIITIYLPGKILTYRIVSAYRYDNRNILARYDFTKKKERKLYLETVLNPPGGYVRGGIVLDEDDHILTLSTCASSCMERRLIQAVLDKEEEID